jgi:hypothetical protein
MNLRPIRATRPEGDSMTRLFVVPALLAVALAPVALPVEAAATSDNY